MAAIAEISNGQVVNKPTTNETKTSNSSLDKDAFLQLLVTQMKYQDPLQPTSNTEYISQLATFSELEEMQNLNSGMTLQRASGLVGQYVFMKVTDSNGNTAFPEGKVDYVVYENNKAFLSIGGELYSIDDLDTVADTNYLNASKAVEAFIKEMDKLPSPERVAQVDMERIESLIVVFENMTDYEKEFFTKEQTALYNKYYEQYEKQAIEPVRSFISTLNELPTLEEVTMEDVSKLQDVIKKYDNFSSYQKTLLSSEINAAYSAYFEKYKELTTA